MKSDAKNFNGLERIWRSLSEEEANIIIAIAFASHPVSIDTLGVLSGASAVSILNVTDLLKKKKWVYEKKALPRGNYFVNGTDIESFLLSHVPVENLQPIILKTIDFYDRNLTQGNQKTLKLAALYHQFGPHRKSYKVIGEAAKLLLDANQREKAAIYFDFLIEHLVNGSLTDTNMDILLDGLIGKFRAAKHLMPIQEQLALLNQAEKIAKDFQKWEYLTNIELALGQVLQAAGQHKKAYQHMEDFWELAARIGDPHMLKVATLLTSDYIHWKGKFKEVVRRYEEVVEDLEQFGSDEATLKATARVGLCFVRCGRIARGLGMIETVRAKAMQLKFQQTSVFADLMTTLAFFEIRKISDAQFYIDRICALPEDVTGHYVLWPIEACKAYILSQKERYEEAFECFQRAVEHSRFVGWIHQNGAWNFEYLDIMESKGFIDQKLNYDGEIKRMLAWDDIYTKGIAYRFRAIRSIAGNQNVDRILSDLKNSETSLKEAGAVIELARTRICLGNFLIKQGETKRGEAHIENAWTSFPRVDKELFPTDLLVFMPQEQKIKVMIDRMIDINQLLGTVHDAAPFTERSLAVGMEFTGAMRGAFFSNGPDGQPATLASRNLDPLMLKIEGFDLIRNVISEVAGQGKEFVYPSVDGGIKGFQESSTKAGISSLICMPATLGEETYGFLYIDNHIGGQAFPEQNLLYMRLLCSQIAVGLFNTRMFDEVKARKDRLEDEAIFYKREMGVASPVETIIGKSKKIAKVINQIQQVAGSDSSVLIEGETGVGKELVAKAIHNLSDRKNGSFIPANLAALPQELVASELFGHEKGAFTGANTRYKGRFELADNGTIFLDEIGDLPANIQVKLLRVLQEGTFERLGSSQIIRSNFRVIAATNKDLPTAIKTGEFRQDLYFRLNVFPIHIPPLRDRKMDIPLLSEHFLHKFSKKSGKSFRYIPKAEIKALMNYSWPGNVRELEHIIERAVIVSSGDSVNFDVLNSLSCNSIEENEGAVQTLSEMERAHILKALQATRCKVGGPNGAAELLGLKPSTLFFRMKKLGIRRVAS